MMEEDIFEEFDKFDFRNNPNFQTGWAAISSILEPHTIGVEYLRAKIFFFSKHCKAVDLQKYLLWKKAKSAPCDDLKQNPDHLVGAQEGDNGSPLYESGSPPQESSGSVNSALSTRNIERDIPPCKDKEAAESNTGVDNSSSTSHEDLSQMLHLTSLELDHDHKEQSESKTEYKRDNEESCVKSNQNKHSNSDNGKDREKNENGNTDTCDKEVSCDQDSESGKSLSLIEIANHIQNGIPIPGLVKVDVQPSNLDPTPSNCTRRLKPWETTRTETECMGS